MLTRLETCFTVFPEHTNSSSPLIFGGAFFGEMDKLASITVRRFLYSSPTGCNNAVTHKANVVFCKPSYQGQLIFLNSEIMSVGPKSIVLNVKASRESLKDGSVQRELIAEIDFVFVSIFVFDEQGVTHKPDLLPYHQHGITDDELQRVKAQL